MRWFAAFLIAPLPGTLLLMLLTAASNGPRGQALIVMIGLPIVAWLIQLLPGLQIAAWAGKLGARRWWHFAVTGMALYALALSVYSIWLTFNVPLFVAVSSIVRASIRFLIFGALCGVTAWFIMRPALERSDHIATAAALKNTFD